MKTVPFCIAALVATLPLALHAQELAPDSDPPQSAVMPAAQPDPEAAAARVSQALKDSKEVGATDITVSTHAATVVLTGEANSEAERVAATSTARKAAEGVRVSSNIEVRPMEERSLKDQQRAQQSTLLVRDVEAALKADQRTANLGVAVTSNDGNVVVLQGLVPSNENRTLVQSVVSKVKGVTRVENRLIVP